MHFLGFIMGFVMVYWCYRYGRTYIARDKETEYSWFLCIPSLKEPDSIYHEQYPYCCLMKASTRSFHFWIFLLSSFMYQFRAAPLKLSWKKCINNFFFMHDFGHLVAIRLEVSGRVLSSSVLYELRHTEMFCSTTFKTRRIFVACTRSYKSTHLITPYSHF
jgi:hypothetical protein